MRRRFWAALLGMLLAGVLVGGFATFWLPMRQVVQPVLRAVERHRTIASLVSYHRQESEHYELYYTDVDANLVPLILETAERVWAPVTAQMNAAPNERVPLILYATRDDLRVAFGWGQSESALGVYWKGTIRLLSPNVWLDNRDSVQQAEEFDHLNPIAHELTHYILDERTGGNYTRWFTEALAQSVEQHVTGYLWVEPSSRLSQNLYSYTQLDDSFESLENQPLAYRQSYLFLQWLEQRSGQADAETFIQQLAKGYNFPKAFAASYGAPPEQLFSEWQDWAVAHASELDEPLIP